MTPKLNRWLFFGVLASLLPIGANYVFLSVGQPDWPSLALALRNGESFLITATMCAVALGEVIGAGRAYENVKIVAGGASLLFLLISTGFFLLFATKNRQMSDGFVIGASLLIYVLSVLSSSVCIRISEASDVS